MKAIILSYDPAEYTVMLDPTPGMLFMSVQDEPEPQTENTSIYIDEVVTPIRKKKPQSAAGKYVYAIAGGKYSVRIWDNGEQHTYGTFRTLEEATAVRDLALKAHHVHLLGGIY
ncbi:hypothetical protein ACX27_26815 [Nostoc piscinale CENA21]|uniref:Uncharacterized protein n=1 Tax=Nostoc piscinale CENA21 TaxID=224013 RepID=A0A0M4T811_9NOSO|nr:hypothetical protein [Nostoc piscinale]ALF55641.1 hypothetical protein ACX27_26815 [Nostoc piscinale CENA21]